MSVPRRVWGFALAAAAFLLAIVGLILNTGTADLTPLLLMSALIVTIALIIWLLFSVFSAGTRILFGSHFVARILGFGVAMMFFSEMITAPFQAAAKAIRLFSPSLAPLLQAWPQLSASDSGAVAVLRTLINGTGRSSTPLSSGRETVPMDVYLRESASAAHEAGDLRGDRAAGRMTTKYVTVIPKCRT